MFWILLQNKNLRIFWGWFVIKYLINKNSISLPSKIMCSYMRVFTVLMSAEGVQITETVAFKLGSDDICKNPDSRALGIFPS